MSATSENSPLQKAEPRPRIALVTGTLAEPALRRVAAELNDELNAESNKIGTAEPTVVVLNIQVAALMTVEWVAKKLVLPGEPREYERVIVPGYCRGDLTVLEAKLGVPVERGPDNLHDLPTYLGRKNRTEAGEYGQFDIEIIAEINHAARLPIEVIIAMATEYQTAGADVIDIGCDPQMDRPAWAGVGDVVRTLTQQGLRVSVDSFQPDEVAIAVEAGAELVLSVNSSNREHAVQWKTSDGQTVEVVAIPDTPTDLDSLDETVAYLSAHGIPFRIDPIIEPIGFGFATSLGRYLAVRQRYPDAQIMMGIGNLSEMTEVDSAGVNMLLIGFCQELGIRSVLTTQVINWCRSAVAEIDIARRVVRYAAQRSTPPKHIDERLVMLRDPKQRRMSAEELTELAQRLTDKNFRIFAENGLIHAMNREAHATGDDPFEVFDQLNVTDPSHAFYLGFEMAKAMTALTLGKNYVQDEPLRWGMLTRQEVTHFERRKKNK